MLGVSENIQRRSRTICKPESRMILRMIRWGMPRSRRPRIRRVPFQLPIEWLGSQSSTHPAGFVHRTISFTTAVTLGTSCSTPKQVTKSKLPLAKGICPQGTNSTYSNLGFEAALPKLSTVTFFARPAKGCSSSARVPQMDRTCSNVEGGRYRKPWRQLRAWYSYKPTSQASERSEVTSAGLGSIFRCFRVRNLLPVTR
jgi:hypothetical protein